jgi:hypothetical protein
LSSINRPGSRIDGYKAIVDPDRDLVFGVVSADYILTPHEQMLETIQKVVKDMPEFGAPTETINLYDNGAKMRATYVFKEVEATIKGRRWGMPSGKPDKLRPQIEVFNSYDSGWSRRIFFGAYRLICKNGLTIGEKVFAYRTRHDTIFDETSVKETLMMAMNGFSEQQRIWEQWVDRLTMPNEYERVMMALPLANKDIEAIGEQVEVSSGARLSDIKVKTLSVWLFFNILCQYITHEMKSHLKRAAVESAMRRSFRF